MSYPYVIRGLDVILTRKKRVECSIYSTYVHSTKNIWMNVCT